MRMANINESNQWEGDLYQISRADKVEGGRTGIANRQAQQLGSRTQWLKNQVESVRDYREHTFVKTDADPDGTSAGLKATSEGEVFRVVQGVKSEESFIYYQNKNGVAIPQAIMAGKAAIDAMEVKTALLDLAGGGQFSISSSNGKLIVIDRDGLVRMIEAIFDVGISAPLITGDKAVIGGAELSGVSSFGDSFVISSRKGPIFAVDSTATARVVTLAAEDISLGEGCTLSQPDADMGVFAIKSLSGPVFAIDKDGTVRAVAIDAEEIRIGGENILSLIGEPASVADELPPKNLISADLIQVHYGQSQSQGAAEKTIHGAAFDDNALMANTGIRAINDVVNYTDLVPLRETVIGMMRETFCSGYAIKRREFTSRHKYDADKMRLLFTNGSIGGTAISQLSKGKANYTRFANQVNAVIRLSEASGRTPFIETFNFIQGGSDDKNKTPSAVWIERMEKIMADIREDFADYLYPLAEVPFLSVQICNYSKYGLDKPVVGSAQLQMHLKKTGFYVACPMYWADFYDSMHWLSRVQVMVGGYLAVAKKRLDQCGEFNPLMPVSHQRIGRNKLLVKFNPVGRLVADTEIVRKVSNYGFTCSSATLPDLEITSCEIVSADSVMITASSEIPGDFNLHYGHAGQTGDPTTSEGQGRINGNRGNIRDTQGESEKIEIGDGTGKAPLHNWCVIFTYNLKGELS